jgi:glucose-6-phosphate dehydrogenase assembly protein OpcA
MTVVSDAVWSARGTTPDAIEAALRELLKARHAENTGWVPARVLNMIAFVDREYSGEIANRLRGVGRYHASRTIVLSYDPLQERLDAHASVASEGDPTPGELALLRETVVVDIGEHHLDDLPTIVDPLVVSDMPTLLWSPHGHADAVDALLGLAQAVLLDSIDEPVWRDAVARAQELSQRAYVVDLAWLRSIPWRERVASTFDPPRMRPQLRCITSLQVRHHPESTVAAVLFASWLAARLGWQASPLTQREGVLAGSAQAEDHEVSLLIEQDPEQTVRGLAGLTLTTSAGLRLSLDRAPGGLRAHRREQAAGPEQEWTILGASRGEGGVLGEGIRAALLRDPTYAQALHAAQAMLP